jgi:4-aminobutyrate aminotransferase-like enzyme
MAPEGMQHSFLLSGGSEATENAVKFFQADHQSSVLAPLGLSSPTGNVYSSTVNAVNQITCKLGDRTSIVK